MFNGGYVMIDCAGLDLTKGQTPQTINGIYAKTEKAVATGKPLFACGCNWDGKAVTPVQVFAVYFGDTIHCTVSTLQIVIDTDDSIVINNMASANG